MIHSQANQVNATPDAHDVESCEAKGRRESIPRGLEVTGDREEKGVAVSEREKRGKKKKRRERDTDRHRETGKASKREK